MKRYVEWDVRYLKAWNDLIGRVGGRLKAFQNERGWPNSTYYYRIGDNNKYGRAVKPDIDDMRALQKLYSSQIGEYWKTIVKEFGYEPEEFPIVMAAETEKAEPLVQENAGFNKEKISPDTSVTVNYYKSRDIGFKPTNNSLRPLERFLKKDRNGSSSYPRQTNPQIADIDVLESFEICPATEDDIFWIANKERGVYRDIDVMPPELIRRWYRKNPECFWMINRIGFGPVGNMYIFALKPAAFAKMLKGQILEREIRPADIYSRTESKKIRNLHFTSLVCPPPYRVGILYLLKDIIKIARKICDPHQIEYIYALEASSEGRNLLVNNGFTIVGNAEGRRDKHPYYSIRFVDLVSRISHRLNQNENEDFLEYFKQSKTL
jgi:hypothetical protein